MRTQYALHSYLASSKVRRRKIINPRIKIILRCGTLPLNCSVVFTKKSKKWFWVSLQNKNKEAVALAEFQ